MTVLTLPAISREAMQAKWHLKPNTQIFRSPLSRVTQTLEIPGSIWTTTLSWMALDLVDARLMAAFVAKMRGGAGRVYVPPPYPVRQPQNTGLGSPLVNGASQAGASLITDTWTPGAVVKAGDYVAWNTPSGGRELKIIVADVTASGGGALTLTIEPPIREAPADNAALILASPTCIMALSDDDQGALSFVPEDGANLTLDLEERF